MGSLKLPKQLFGSYDQVCKNLRCLKKGNLNDIENFIRWLSEPDNLIINVDFPQTIVLCDSYITRGLADSCFPYLISDFILFEKSVKNSEIVHWYKENVLTGEPWFLLSAIADAGEILTLVSSDFFLVQETSQSYNRTLG